MTRKKHKKKAKNADPKEGQAIRSSSSSAGLDLLSSTPTAQKNESTGMGLTESIFGGGNKTSSSTFPATKKKTNSQLQLFASPQKYRKVSEDRQAKNQQVSLSRKKRKHSNNSDELDSEDDADDHRSAILGSRQRRMDNTQSLLKSITAPSSPDMEDTDDPEICRGVKRLFIGQCDSMFRNNGVLILPNLMGSSASTNSTTIKKLHSKAKQIETDICKRLHEKGKIWQPQKQKRRGKDGGIQGNQDKQHRLQDEDDDEEKAHCFQYHEVASRCWGRLDIRYQMDQYPFSAPEIIENEWLWPLVQSLLGPNAKLVYAGLILSFPESADQPWHQDGQALFDDDLAAVDLDLPPYALNAFIPLEDVTLEVGPTEFWVGSHKESSCHQVMQQLQQQQRKKDRGDEETINDEESIVGPLLKRGDVLLYDYRICHRGTRNLSTTQVRPMLYLMYARPWFLEHLNFGQERLFPPS